MLKILRLTLIVFAISAISTGVICWIAVQQPVPIMAVFTNPDGAPCERLCLFGIQPGLTSIERARELLRSHPLTRQLEPNLEGDIFRQGTTGVIIGWGLGDNRVSNIELVTGSNPDWGSFGQVISALGGPERVLVDEGHTRSYWFAGKVEFFHAHRQPGYLNPDDVLVSVIIRAQPSDLPSQAALWRGFTAIKRYVTARP